MTPLSNLRSLRSAISAAPEPMEARSPLQGSLALQWVLGRNGRLECRWSLRAKDGEPDLGSASAARLQAA